MAEPIAWNVARKTARRAAQLAGARDPFSNSYLGDGFNEQLAELTAEAEPLVAAITGLRVATPATALCVDRPGWANVNVESSRRLLAPALERLAEKTSGPSAAIGRNVTGAELGAVLGWMSTRVMGQYDPKLFPGDPTPQDLIYYVTPNVVSLEKRFAFPPEEFRLWLALHECTHRAQFVGCSWLGEYFRGLVVQLTDTDSFDLEVAIKEMRKAIENKRSRSGSQAGSDESHGFGPLSALGGPERKEALDRIFGLMSLLEGHAEVVMGRAGKYRVPNAERFHRVFAERRKSARGFARFMQKVMGMDMKMRQYEQGAAFVRNVEQHGGEELFGKVWERRENCPTYAEIVKPQLWIERVS